MFFRTLPPGPADPDQTASPPRGRLLLLIILWGILFAPAGEATANTLVYFGQGGQQTVGGSLHVLENSSGLYLIDVGSFVGGDGANYPWPQEIPVASIQALFITHVHADHIGRLPLLLHQGYRGPIHLSRVSYKLARVTLPANLHLLDLGPERFYYSRHNAGRKRIPVYLEGYDFGERTVKPENRVYFTSHRHRLAAQGYYLARPQRQKLEAALQARLEEQAVINDPGQPFTVDDFKARFLATPHMAGSVMVELEYRDLRILFAGDTGANGSPLLPDNPAFTEPIDLLFLEGTYGWDRGPAPAAARTNFRRELATRLAAGYRVVIPAFALDRSQQIVQEIGRAVAAGELPPDQVIRVCSPTARELLNRYADFVRRGEFAPYFRPEVSPSHFLPPGYRPDCSGDDPDNPLGLQHGEIGVMTSGMADHASARQALLDYLEDPKTLFYFASYQAPASLGGRLTAGPTPPTELRIGANRRQVKAKIMQTQAFSGHASPREMIEIFAAAQPRRIYLVHLDRLNAPSLANRYRQEFQAEIIIPQQNERHRLYP